MIFVAFNLIFLKILNIMKKTFLVSVLLLCGMTVLAQDWNITLSPRFRFIQDIYIHNPDNISIVGGHPFNDSITYMAYSGGTDIHWTPYQDIFPGKMLRTLVYLDSDNGFAAGDNETLYKTENGGRFWTLSNFNINLNNKRINKLIKNSNNHLFALGGLNNAAGFILISNDAGISWTIINEWENNEIYSAGVSENGRVIICGNNNLIQYSDNQGNNWHDATLNGEVNNHDVILKSVRFYDNSSAYCVGGIHGADSIAVVLKTIDGGLSWNTVYLAENPCLNDIDFIDAENALAVGYHAFKINTANGGNSWQEYIIPNAPVVDLFSVIFKNRYCGAVGGRSGYVFLYRDSGINFPKATTNEATNITHNSAKLNAIINPGNVTTKVYFQYGETETCDNESLVGLFEGDEDIQISLDLNNLELLTDYFFKVKTTSSYGEYIGEIKDFFTTPENFFFENLDAVMISQTTATLRAKLNPSGVDTQLFFEYGTDSNMENHIYAGMFSGTEIQEVEWTISDLTPNTKYFYNIKIVNVLGSLYGEQKSFTTPDLPETIFVNTQDATQITGNSAILNAKLNTADFDFDVYFQYGTTENTENEIFVGTYNSVTDLHVSKSIGGLTIGTLYYFRAKMVNEYVELYGDTKIFYSGNPIPNWDFELWNMIEYEYPSYWITNGAFVKKEYEDFTAIGLYPNSGDYEDNVSVILNAYFEPDVVDGEFVFLTDIEGGYETSIKPEFFNIRIKYDIEVEDSAMIGFFAFNGNDVIANIIKYLTGSTNNEFVDLQIPITYLSEIPQERIVMAFTNSYPFHEDLSVDFNSSVEIAEIGFDKPEIQIPNSNFSSWNKEEFEIIESWHSDNEALIFESEIYLPYFKTTDSYLNQFAICLQSVMSSFGPLSGHIYSGKFPVNYRHQSFDGYFKYLPDGVDTALIVVNFYYDSEIIGSAFIYIDEEFNEWTEFSHFVQYYVPDITPDSADIRFRTHVWSNDLKNSILCLDKLSFDGDFILVEKIEMPIIEVFPNPFCNYLNISFAEKKLDSSFMLEIFNADARLMHKEELSFQDVLTINTENLDAGLYFMRITDNKGLPLITSKLIKLD